LSNFISAPCLLLKTLLKMTSPFLRFSVVCGLLALLWACQKPSTQLKDDSLVTSLASKRVMLPNGWSLTPVGHSLPLGDLPLNLVASSSGKWLAVTNNGQSQHSIMLIDAASEKVLDTFVIPKAWVGLAFSPDEKQLFASGGNDNKIWCFDLTNKTLKADSSIVLGKPWPTKISPTGLAVNADATVLYTVTKEDNALYICDIPTKKVLDRIPLGGEAYTCVLSPNGQELYISLWGAEKILVFDTKVRKIVSEIPTLSHPNDMAIS
jgi:DNA-binding beta-propeller fold protein YncE